MPQERIRLDLPGEWEAEMLKAAADRQHRTLTAYVRALVRMDLDSRARAMAALAAEEPAQDGAT